MPHRKGTSSDATKKFVQYHASHVYNTILFLIEVILLWVHRNVAMRIFVMVHTPQQSCLPAYTYTYVLIKYFMCLCTLYQV